MRGKEATAAAFFPLVGITPAYAGKSTCGVMHRTYPWDHPRLCGEKGLQTHKKRLLTGSPPPMRGKGTNQEIAFNQRRITPAYAGKRN